VLEPRRIAARLAARFVASQRGEAVGATVGYQVRFEEVAGPATRLRFLTEGVLTRRLLSDPHLERVGTVVLDEFHERRWAAAPSLSWHERKGRPGILHSAAERQPTCGNSRRRHECRRGTHECAMPLSFPPFV
jgi:ATP-dependent helicase HrpB